MSLSKQELKLVEKELLELRALINGRKICWEAEFENGEYAIGEFKVSNFCESVIGRLETERISSNLLRTEVTNLNDKLEEKDKQLSEAKEEIEKITNVCMVDKASLKFLLAENARLTDLLKEIDSLLAMMEDSAHGGEGRAITELRGKIQSYNAL